MSTSLPGNPFVLSGFHGTSADLAVASSSYAVAHEMRTANLIALLGVDEDALPPGIDWPAVRRQVAERLGLQEEGDQP